MEFELFQTLDTRYEIDETENRGPIKCNNGNNAWLGFGYYFWEGDIELAHGWGARRYNNVDYCICKTIVLYDERKILDLVHIPSHRNMFKDICSLIKDKCGYENYHDILIAEVFDYLNQFNEPWMKNFEAVRVYGEKSFKNFAKQIKFDDVKTRAQARLTLNPEIQWCLFKKNSLNRQGFELVYPESDLYICKGASGTGYY